MEEAFQRWQQADRGQSGMGHPPPYMGGPPPMFPPPGMPPPGMAMPAYAPPPPHAFPPPGPPPGLVRPPPPAPPAGAPGPSAPKKTGQLRQAGGKRWRDATLDEWPENDHRIFVGDLGNEVNDDVLAKAFQKYPSFTKAKIVKDPRTKKSKGFGFVSFMDVADFAKALREMNGKYIGNRPCKLRKSTWDERSVQHGQKKQKQKS